MILWSVFKALRALKIMTEKSLITQRDELASLQHEVGLYSSDLRPLMSEALRHVPRYWNADVADQQYDALVWRMAIREQLCSYAVGHIVSIGLSVSMSQKVEGQVRRNLINLGLRD
jgi:hypothetical protein